jgi:hypothetical protein
MKTLVHGPAAQLIDSCFAAKLTICEAWDKALGLKESDPFSAVQALKSCYAVRRPFFVATDVICVSWSGL